MLVPRRMIGKRFPPKRHSPLCRLYTGHVCDLARFFDITNSAVAIKPITPWLFCKLRRFPYTTRPYINVLRLGPTTHSGGLQTKYKCQQHGYQLHIQPRCSCCLLFESLIWRQQQTTIEEWIFRSVETINLRISLTMFALSIKGNRH